ncbi:MAG: mannose-6-phosphate isomerase [Flavobacterium sp.]|nr:mannose-6-phosphate isomerase [Flavobacterium sp.]
MKTIYDKRPWGLEEILTINEPATVKILTINSGQRSSLQYHNHRKEFWKIIEGEAIFEINNKKIEAKIGDEVDIKNKITHRLIAKDKVAKILEISFGEFDENDIVRLEDDYGRVK